METELGLKGAINLPKEMIKPDVIIVHPNEIQLINGKLDHKKLNLLMAIFLIPLVIKEAIDLFFLKIILSGNRFLIFSNAQLKFLLLDF